MSARTPFINSLLEAGFRGGTYTGGTITMKLFTVGLPSGSGVEVTGGSYAAQTLTFSAAASKTVATSATAVFTNLPIGAVIVARGIYSGATLIDEGMLSSSFIPDVTNNELRINYSFSIGA